jgi:predicted nucleotide-binding protein (sugar kinase/HSP70/actin superfamily)
MVATRELDTDKNPLAGKTVYVPDMCPGSARLFCGALRGSGIDARTYPPGDARTHELAARHVTGDECYPQIVTLGNFLKIAEEPGFSQEKTALFMPTASGPCRFGQYTHITRRSLDQAGYPNVSILSPTCDNGYRDVGENGRQTMRHGWWALLAGDIVRKMLHRTRPYEREAGAADAAYETSLADIEEVLSRPDRRGAEKFADVREALGRSLVRFRSVDADYSRPRLFIGVVGEIFCRLNIFSNEDIVRRIERHGGEVWLSDIAEWIFYVNEGEMKDIRSFGNPYSPRMAKAWFSNKVQRREEHLLTAPFAEALTGWEEPETVEELLRLGAPYLDPRAALGEMMINVGKAVWLHRKGADGMADISPFSCMNGIVSQAIYPVVSRDHDEIPLRTFYFDGTQTNLDEDVGIFMELAANYSRKKKHPRTVPPWFGNGMKHVA